MSVEFRGDTGMGARHLDIIDDPARARVALQPIRLRLLHLLEQPQSAPQVARALGMPRQRVLYHLRRLEAERLVEARDHGSVGRRIDRSYVRTATSYAVTTISGMPASRRGRSSSRATAGTVEELRTTRVNIRSTSPRSKPSSGRASESSASI